MSSQEEKDCYFFKFGLIVTGETEKARVSEAAQVFERYRKAFDTILQGEQKCRASVYFFVNMLEAYYFADVKAVNQVLGTSLNDHEGDVETISHPKGNLKSLISNKFNEIEHGGEILDILDVKKALSRPDTCAFLRTLFAWCVKVLTTEYPEQTYRNQLSQDFACRYKLNEGIST
jgi:hypothetical protein